MATLNVASKVNQATTLPVLLVAAYVNEVDPNARINVKIEDVDKLPTGATSELHPAHGEPVSGAERIIHTLIESHESLQTKEPSLVEEWIARLPAFAPLDFKVVEVQLLQLNSHLVLRSHIVGYSLSPADLAIFGAIRGNRVAIGVIKKGVMMNLSRWYRYIEESNPWITETVQKLNATANEKKVAASKKGGSYDIELKDTSKGVVTRFPPEPSGYLHIGHAKAALLNDYFAHEAYPGGKMICRFDDTNPSKEKEEFQDAIVEDLALMGIKPDQTSYSSDYFEEMYQYCVKMIKEGKAYADDTDQETMRAERMDGIASKRRDSTPEANLTAFEGMRTGAAEGLKWCIRAKMSVDNPNKAMRDPVIYRCNLTPHHRTGTTWKVYPTYDFCAPVVDSIEGVTHALRTMEYRDRNPQYDWMQAALGLRSVHIWDFARMNFIRTLLSKRKLTKFVEAGIVWGWDDPRFPTIRGIRRRGMTIPALREFILRQGPSRNVVNLDWTLFWATNKKHIDNIAPRHTAISKKDIVTCTISHGPTNPYSEDRPRHPKNKEIGLKKLVFASKILVEQEDAQSFAQDEEITLMTWGNAIVRKITHSLNPLHLSNVTGIELELHLEGDFKTTSKKVTWLAAEGQELVPVELVDFDFLITKDKIEEEDNVDDFMTPETEFRTEALADLNVATLQKDDIIQFERKGYFRVDKAYGETKPAPAVLFLIPTGKEEKLVTRKKEESGK